MRIARTHGGHVHVAPVVLPFQYLGLSNWTVRKETEKYCVQDYVRKVLIVVDIRVRLSLRHPNLVAVFGNGFLICGMTVILIHAT